MRGSGFTPRGWYEGLFEGESNAYFGHFIDNKAEFFTREREREGV